MPNFERKTNQHLRQHTIAIPLPFKTELHG